MIKKGNSTNDDLLIDFYNFHSKIYDLTRWTILFGRGDLIKKCPNSNSSYKSILEIGSGTGHNLLRLKAKYPDSTIYGYELSSKMSSISERKIKNKKDIFIIPKKFDPKEINMKMDLIIISYVLTMTKKEYETIIDGAIELLNSNGIIAVLDFHNSPSSLFKMFMKNAHVTMDGKILEYLRSKFSTQKSIVKSKYFGLFSYFTFYGQNIHIN